MATFNGARFLQQQLDSIAGQSYAPFELVAVDDGSSDSTVELLEGFAAHSSFPVRVFRNDVNLGSADNFIRAANLCEGDWIAFADQDDWWLPAKLKRFNDTIEHYAHQDLVMVGHTSLLANVDLALTGQRLPDFRQDAVTKPASHPGFFCIVGFSMACHRRLVRDFSPELRPRQTEVAGVPPGHDQWLGMLANVVGRVAEIAEPLAIWRRHSDSLTRPPAPTRIDKEIAVALEAWVSSAYALRAAMAAEASEYFAKLAEQQDDTQLKERLSSGAQRFTSAAANLRGRADLYSAARYFDRMAAFLKLVGMNAYLNHRMCRLGAKSLFKDAAFTMGVIGWNRH